MTTQNNMTLDNQLSYSLALLDLYKLVKLLPRPEYFQAIRTLNQLDAIVKEELA